MRFTLLGHGREVAHVIEVYSIFLQWMHRK